ncbi:hypothetical protein OCH7691_00822 [Oceanibacterium hippocampi]|uniref:DUF3426 domain-containing protein n=1 Tax=Oceanibacterium hippocampi TaxID=745714 RepID=A0A1Y5RVK7_9PROT|nr:hypothetical protein OCH7691_00822 [Oceanibacterium hippocampi]
MRCAKCSHTWREFPPPPSALPDNEIPITPPPPPEPEDVVATGEGEGARRKEKRGRGRERGRNLPALRKERRSGYGLIGWLALLVVVAALCAGALLAREQIVQLWPASSKLYGMLQMPVNPNQIGLEFENVKPSKQPEKNGEMFLIVSGDIRNVARETRPLPRLRIALQNADQQEIYHWTADLGVSELAAGDVLHFSKRLKNPPAAAVGVKVTFVETGGQEQ